MENSENNTNNSSFCKICAQNGFESIRIFWKSIGEKEEGKPIWKPHEDHECTIPHTHRYLEPQNSQATEEQVQNTQLYTDRTGRKLNPTYDKTTLLANNDAINILHNLFELYERQHQLLEELLEKIQRSP